MVSLNKVFLGGNLTRDPELRFTPGNVAVTDVGLAINQSYQSKTGERREETTFVNVEVWGKQAETVCQYLKKGSQVIVEGNLKFESWEQDGQKRSRLKVRAARVQFVGSQQSREQQGAPSYQQNNAGGGYQPAPQAPQQAASYQVPPPSFDDDEGIPF